MPSRLLRRWSRLNRDSSRHPAPLPDLSRAWQLRRVEKLRGDPGFDQLNRLVEALGAPAYRLSSSGTIESKQRGPLEAALSVCYDRCYSSGTPFVVVVVLPQRAVAAWVELLPQRAVAASGVPLPHRAVDPHRAVKAFGSLLPHKAVLPHSAVEPSSVGTNALLP